jgi:magnesium-transporting ATPase (P-type)
MIRRKFLLICVYYQSFYFDRKKGSINEINCIHVRCDFYLLHLKCCSLHKNSDACNSHVLYFFMQGVPLKFDLLNVIEFSSERKRMSVVARCPDGTIRLFCKGADNTILERLSPGQEKEYMESTHSHLRRFAQQGLRTLCLGTRVIPMGAYREWDGRFQAASALMDGREEQMAQLQEEVERDLELVGVTAIEDKLQEGVPQAIDTLLDAGIKVGITGLCVCHVCIFTFVFIRACVHVL